jgi:acyl-CoA thioesterase I
MRIKTNRFALFSFALLMLAPFARGEPSPRIVFFGDSLSAGWGIDPEQAFPSLVQEKIESAGLPHRVINAGVSGDTTASGLRRVDWTLRQPVDVFVLELGGNDGLRGFPPEETRRNLQAIIDRVRVRAPKAKIVIAGMEAPPNMGREFASEFRAIFPDLAEANQAVLIPFLLEGVGGVRELNLPDGIHPTPRGHQIIASLVWETLKPLLKEPRSRKE